MIRQLARSEGRCLGYEISGKIDAAQEKRWTQELDEAVATYSSLRLLVVLDPDARWGLDAGIADLKWLTVHMTNIERIAVVTDSSVWRWLVSIDGFFAGMVGIAERHFDTAHLDDAWDWLFDNTEKGPATAE